VIADKLGDIFYIYRAALAHVPNRQDPISGWFALIR